MSNLYQRMTETLALNMGDTLVVNRQFEEAVNYIANLEQKLAEATRELMRMSEDYSRVETQCQMAEIERDKLRDALKWIRGLAGTLDVAVSIADKTLKDSNP